MKPVILLEIAAALFLGWLLGTIIRRIEERGDRRILKELEEEKKKEEI